MTENTETYKLFVGNVPFKCTQEEFSNVFDKEQGFMTAELIYRTKSELTRGFGFVEFSTGEDLDSTLEKQFYMDGRELRVAKYFEDRNYDNNEQERAFKVFTRNTNDLNVDQLREYFSKYGNVSECYLLVDRETQEPKGHGVVGFDNKNDWNSALNDRDVDINGTMVTVYPFKYRNKVNKFNKFNKYTGENKTLYRDGYNDGVAAGYNKGYEDGYNKGWEDNLNGEEKDSTKNYLKRPFLKNVVTSS